MVLSTLTNSNRTLVIKFKPSGAQLIPTAHSSFALPIYFIEARSQKSISPSRLPNPPINTSYENGQILIVFLNLLPNSNMGFASLSYKVAVAGYVPDITMNCSPEGVHATS